MTWIYLIFSIVFTVMIHELAHMVVALICKVRVEAFSIGFGKPIWHKTIKGIDFRLSPIPLGGYCRLEGEKSTDKKGWLTKRYSVKIAIVLAGVIINLLVAFICYWINYKSLLVGIRTDWLFMKFLLIKDYASIVYLHTTINPNPFLFQLGLLNFIAFITNIFPFPALDGGYVFLFPLEKLLKAKFGVFLDKITRIGFMILIIAQFALLYYFWFLG